MPILDNYNRCAPPLELASNNRVGPVGENRNQIGSWGVQDTCMVRPILPKVLWVYSLDELLEACGIPSTIGVVLCVGVPARAVFDINISPQFYSGPQ